MLLYFSRRTKRHRPNVRPMGKQRSLHIRYATFHRERRRPFSSRQTTRQAPSRLALDQLQAPTSQWMIGVGDGEKLFSMCCIVCSPQTTPEVWRSRHRGPRRNEARRLCGRTGLSIRNSKKFAIFEPESRFSSRQESRCFKMPLTVTRKRCHLAL